MRRFALFLFVIALVFGTQPQASAQSKPDKDYLIYVLSESADTIALVRFGPNGARVDHNLKTGAMPSDLSGQEVLLRFAGSWPAVWHCLEI
jgi:hypothetical protein